jgi:hypothetical protein
MSVASTRERWASALGPSSTRSAPMSFSTSSEVGRPQRVKPNIAGVRHQAQKVSPDKLRPAGEEA